MNKTIFWLILISDYLSTKQLEEVLVDNSERSYFDIFFGKNEEAGVTTMAAMIELCCDFYSRNIFISGLPILPFRVTPRAVFN